MERKQDGKALRLLANRQDAGDNSALEIYTRSVMRPNTGNATLIAALHLALLLAAPVLGAEEGTVDGVLGRYVKAIGGKEAWNKVESRSIKAEYRAVDGLQYPHVQQLRISGAGQEIEVRMKVKEVTHDEEFEDSIFSRPTS
jgi:hypothetical protein